MALHLSSDLMLVGKLSSFAKAQGLDYSSFSNTQKLLERLKDHQTVLVDLQIPNLEIDAFIESIRSSAEDIRVVAYAQHVLTDLIEAAQQAGCDLVLTRGQFDRGFVEYLV